ncbi:MAG: peptidase S8 [Caulobacteraceae bacterium]|nr:peptidase S8 [Caulobacteraceae bacterium]
MHRAVSVGLVSAGMVLAGASLASARVVERSGNTFHTSVCPETARERARCHAHVVTDSAGRAIVNSFVKPNLPSGYGPADLRSAYKIVTSGNPGTIIAIVDAFGYKNAESDLAVYRSTFGLPACTTANGCFTKYNQNGKKKNYPPDNVGWAQETALDLDMASAICEDCTIILVEGDSNTFGNLAAAVDTAAGKGAHVISNSYGGGESGGSSFESHYNHAGVAITASTGDSGYGAQFPATSDHVVAVGGTHLVRSGGARGWTETVWRGTGSGCSGFFPKPAWQTDRKCHKRMEADVSAVADPATGVAVYGPNGGGGSSWLVFGGTSVSAPLIGGVYGVNGGPVNYASDPYAHTNKLYDVTVGANGTCPFSYWCNAQVGYDGPTGLGTPHGVDAF